MDGPVKERDLFSVGKVKRGKKFGKRKKDFGKDKDGEPSSKKAKHADAEDEAHVKMEMLSYMRLTPGLVTLGRIIHVTSYELYVSLPCMLTGVVPITRICEAYTALLKKVTESKDDDDAEDQTFSLQSLFKKGQYVVTKVESIKKKEHLHQVYLCLLPKEVNFGVSAMKLEKGLVIPCAVSSVEDNGYAMDTGIPNVDVAFLNRGKTEGAGIVGIGNVVRCVITHVKRTDGTENVHLKLSAIPSEVNKSQIDVAEADDLSLLLPGTVINTTIVKVLPNSLRLMLPENDGVVCQYHLETPMHQTSDYNETDPITANVLYITPLSRTVHLSLQKCIFSQKPEVVSQDLTIGDRKMGEVIKYTGKGVFFKIGQSRAFCAKTHLTDKPKEDALCREKFQLTTEHLIRVTGYHHFDETFICSLQKACLNKQTIGLHTMKVGQVLNAIIQSYDHEHRKAIATVGSKIEGEIPFMHLTDAAAKHPEKKYNIGRSVEVKVLELNPERKRLVLTCKTLLVNSEDTLVSEYNKDFENTFTTGFIVKVLPLGLVIAFYNGVKGFVPKKEATAKSATDLSKIFTVGNVVKCKILKVSPDAEKMTLSLIGGQSADDESKISKKKLGVRSIVKCKVHSVDNDAVRVLIEPENLQAVIPMAHLSDENESQCRSLSKILCKGDDITNAAVFEMSNIIVLSLKDSVCRWIQNSESQTQEQFEVGSIYPAVVSEVLSNGAMVSVPVGNDCQQLYAHNEPSGKSSEKDLVKMQQGDMYVGKSVHVKCAGFDDQKEPILSIYHDNADNKSHQLQAIYNHLGYLKLLQKDLSRKGLVSKQFGNIEVGNRMKMDIVAITVLGLYVVNSEMGIHGVVMKEHFQPNNKYKIGNTIITSVLHVDIIEKCLVLTARLDLVRQLYVHESSNLKAEHTAKSEVLFSQEEFTLVMFKSTFRGLIAYLPPIENVKLGQNVPVTVKYVERKFVIGVTKAKGKQVHLPVNSNLPRIQFYVKDEQIDAKYIDVKVNEKSALEKIRSIVKSVRNLEESSSQVVADVIMMPKTSEKEKKVSKKGENNEKSTGLTVNEDAKTDGGMAKKNVKKEGKKKKKENAQVEKVNGIEKKGGKEKEGKKKKKENAQVVKVNGIEKKVGKEKEVKKKKKEKVNGIDELSNKGGAEVSGIIGKEKPKKKRKVSEMEGNPPNTKKEKTKKTKKIEGDLSNNLTLVNTKAGVEKIPKKSSKGKESICKEEEQDSGVDESMDLDLPVKNKAVKSCLKINTGFVWDVPTTDNMEEVEESSDGEDDENNEIKRKKAKKLTRAEREVLAKEEEKRLYDLESARLEKERLPQTALDYEELLQESPNSSAIWIQLISFHLENAEVERARSIAQRALQVINVEEFEERINVWTVMLRLEVLYGTEESVGAAFREALATNDPLKMYIAMAMIYAESNRMKEAEELYFKMSKKFKQDMDVWVKAGIFFFKNNKLDEARKYMDRALLSLEKKNHVNLINRFAQLEFQFGEVERGKTMFESLLSNYPKRIDMWIVYVDLLAKNGDVEGARKVLERATGLKLRLRQMRSIFKKFLEFEKNHGSTLNVELVKKRVQDYVAASLEKD